MCLTISCQNSFVITYLSFLVGKKLFYFDSHMKLYSPFIGEDFNLYYEFTKDQNDILVSKQRNSLQEVDFIIDIYLDNRKISGVIEKNLKLGYHISPFKYESNNKYGYKERNFDYEVNKFYLNEPMLIIPVLFKYNDIQIIGNDIVVNKFYLPNKTIYKDICCKYNINLDKSLANFLGKLYEVYCEVCS